MFSQIGDYIHFSYSNYRKMGLMRGRKDGVSRNISQRATLEKYLNAIPVSSGLKEYSTKAIEAQINKIRNTYSGSEEGAQTAQAMQSSITNIMQQIAKNIEPTDINWDTATIKPSSIDKVLSKIDLSQVMTEQIRSLRTITYNSLGKKAGGGIRSHVSKAAIKRHLQIIARGIVALSQQGSDVTKLKKKLKDINAQFVSLAQSIDASADYITVDSRLLQRTTNENTGHLENKGLLEDIATLARETFRATSLAEIEGVLAEAIVAEALTQLKGIGAESIKDIMGDFITKAQSGTIKIDKQNFMKGLDMDSILNSNGFHWKSDASGNTYQIDRMVKGKSDIFAIINTTDTENQIRTLAASIKNYNLKAQSSDRLKNISLVKGTNLIYLFQKQGEMLNHYLNQTAMPTDPTNRHKISPPPASIIIEANRIMQKAIVLMGIQGGGLRTDVLSEKAQDYYIQMDKSQKGANGVKVMTISSLWNRLIHMIKIGGFNNVAEIVGIDDHTTWNNVYSNTKEDRITGLLREVKKQPINVSIKKTAIQMLMKS